MKNNYFILNLDQGIFFFFFFVASSSNQSGFSKENESHSMYSKDNTATSKLTPVAYTIHLSLMLSGVFALLSSKSHW